jgi:2-C-methyl-D-erythritol 4-phosphate cytidylyltransferase
MLMHVLDQFETSIHGIRMIVALPAGHGATWERLCGEHRFMLPHETVTGGLTRFESVKNALSLAGDEGLVAVHDGARPLVSVDLIRRSFAAAAERGSSVPVVAVTESIRRIDGQTNVPVDRRNYFRVQTPQVFPSSLLQQAYRQAYRPEFTDDASVVEAMGVEIHTIMGEDTNLKITTREDFLLAASLLGPDLRESSRK